ncbi:hypothetical protein BDK51DRAFT_26884, partial [Blyttiomyces helicus]
MASNTQETAPLLGGLSEPADLPTSPTPSRLGRFGILIGLFAGFALSLGTEVVVPPATPSHNSTDPAFPRPDTVNWKRCGDLECSTFTVPLNHSDPTGRTIDLALIRHKATVQPSLGSMFVNPGGPGGSGIDMYDIIGFDPRGIGLSTPVKCFDSATSHLAFDTNLGLFPRRGDAADEALYAMRARVRAELCFKNAGDLLPFTSTAAVARDLDLLREAVGEELLHYYGYSYGTFLGSTYVNMFPERVGRVIVDAVVDPREFSGEYFDFIYGGLIHTEAAVDAMAAACEDAGPDRCAMAPKPPRGSRSHPRTGPSVASRIRTLVASLDTNPLPAPNAAVPGVLTTALASNVIFLATYQTVRWPAVMEALARAEEGDGTLLRNLAVPAPADACPTRDESGGEGFLAVTCADQTPGGIVDFVGFKGAVAKAENVSYFGGREWAYTSLPCFDWGVKAHEAFRGPWNHVTKNK